MPETTRFRTVRVEDPDRALSLIVKDIDPEGVRGPLLRLDHAATMSLYRRLADAERRAEPNSREVDVRDRRLHVLARLNDVLSAEDPRQLREFVASTRRDYPDVFEDIALFERMSRESASPVRHKRGEAVLSRTGIGALGDEIAAKISAGP